MQILGGNRTVLDKIVEPCCGDLVSARVGPASKQVGDDPFELTETGLARLVELSDMQTFRKCGGVRSDGRAFAPDVDDHFWRRARCRAGPRLT